MKLVTMVTTCAWCKLTMRFQNDVLVGDDLQVRSIHIQHPPIGGPRDAPFKEYGRVLGVESHGCCKKCHDNLMAEVNALPTVKGPA